MSAAGARTNRSAGFTLVESLIAILSASILVLAMSSMLWFGFLSWARMRGAMEMQRDMRASMDVLSRAVRPATNMTFTTGLVFTAYAPGRPPASVYASGANLFFDRDTTTAGGAVQLVFGSLTRFSVSFGTNRDAVVTLALTRAQESMSNRVVLTRRN